VTNVASEIDGELKEEVGKPGLVADGANNLYGPAYKQPKAISGVNSYWMRRCGNLPPQTVIVLAAELLNVWG
jgi:hypothetical protein